MCGKSVWSCCASSKIVPLVHTYRNIRLQSKSQSTSAEVLPGYREVERYGTKHVSQQMVSVHTKLYTHVVAKTISCQYRYKRKDQDKI